MINRKGGSFVAAGLFFGLGVIFVLIKPETLVSIITIDSEKHTYSGSMPVLMFGVAAAFVWFALRKTKDDVLDDAKKSLEDAAKRLVGSVINLSFRIGPDSEISELKKLLKSGKLEGVYRVKQKGVELKRPDNTLRLFEDPIGGAIMAEVEEVRAEADTLIEIVVKEKGGTRLWRASESVRIRIIHLELEKRF